MRGFSDIPRADLTLMDLHEECDRRISRLDPAQFKSDDQYEAAVERIVEELLSELKDIWK